MSSPENDSTRGGSSTGPPGLEDATDEELELAGAEPEPEGVHVPPVQAPIADDDTDEQVREKLREQGVRLGKGSIAPAVFWPSMIVIVAVAAVAIIFPDATAGVLETIQGWIVTNLGWFYMLSIGIFIVFSLVMCFSRYGKIRLGADDERPEFGLLSWFSMLFAAGMGIGLVFYGVGEPLTYATSDPKPGWEGDQTEIAQLGMAQTFVHWGLHPWAVYAVIGLALAYAIHRRGRPVSIRWALEPILGDRVKGWAGDLIDVLAIFGTLFGIATSLGLGVQQIATGMQAMGLVDTFDNVLLVILIVVITFIATFSVVSGLGRGIKWLSNINLSLAGILLITVLLLGPTVFLFQNFVESIGVYLANVLGMTFEVGAYAGPEGNAWASTWTLFYWGWWVSWAPFVGVFIARISRGRTIRQFVAGVLLVPTLVGFFWFSVMGGSGLFRQLFGTEEEQMVAPGEDVVAEAALFDVLQPLPLGTILSFLAIILVAIFFITSSDSGSLVVDMLASGGHPNPPTWSRVLWALLEGALAIGLLLAGGLEALQAAALATALPFSIILLAMCVATLRAVRKEAAERDRRELQMRYELFRARLGDDFDVALGGQVDHRVDNRINYRLSATRGVFERASSESGGSGGPGGDGGPERPGRHSK